MDNYKTADIYNPFINVLHCNKLTPQQDPYKDNVQTLPHYTVINEACYAYG